MKKILLALGIIGILPFSAEAQKKSVYDKNYPVCIADNKYVLCNDAAKATEEVGRDVKVTSPDKSLRMFDSYVHMGYRTTPSASNRRNPRILVSYEDPNGAYEGKETRINDGVQKNKARNLNYLDGSVQLPPVDGGQ
jgi:hypothetical protein